MGLTEHKPRRKLKLIHRMSLTVALAFAISACGSGEDPADEATQSQQAAVTNPALAQPCVQLPTLPGTDPSKSPVTVCETAVAKPVSSQVGAKQQLYLQACQAKLAADWHGLSEEEQEAKRLAFKRAFFGTNGGQP